jgi:hypothetical protein
MREWFVLRIQLEGPMSFICKYQEEGADLGMIVLE